MDSDIVAAPSAASTTMRGDAIAIDVTGMTCASCVRRVERALGRVPGVAAVAVNLASERAHVSTGGPVDAAALVQAVAASGYGTATGTTELEIAGMTCASCVGRVERALGRVPGVLAARVNLATEHARVTTLRGSAPPDALIAAVERAGYRAAAPASRDDATLAGGTEAASDRRDLVRALAAAALSIPLLVGMVAHVLGAPTDIPGWLQFALATPVQFWLGARFYAAAWKAVRAGSGNMDLLVVLGTTAAWGLSTAELLLHAGTAAPLYFDSAALVITFILFGRWLERRARRRTASSIRALSSLRPETARRRQTDGRETDVAVASLRLGDVVLVRPGERFPADGRVIEGEGDVDLSMLTGESLPVATGIGDPVAGGAIATDGAFAVAVTAIGAETMLARIIRMVEAAQSSKAPVERLVDRVSAVFVPTVLVIALVTFVCWWLATGNLAIAILDAVAVTVIACPCALGLATPTAMVVGIGAAARHGILIRDADALERAHGITVVAFDKTGTLTEGHPEVASVTPEGHGDAASLLGLAASLLASSEHPLAAAVVARAGADGLRPRPVAAFRARAGRGVCGEIDGRTLIFGNGRLLAEHGLTAEVAAAERDAGRTVSFLAELGDRPRVLGAISFVDRVKATGRDAVAALRARAIRTVMLTGDNEGAARVAAGALGIDEVRAEMRPEDKVDAIVSLRGPGQVVAMVGDGLNDAAALAAADIGIAMATGTDVAIETAGIALLRGDPRLVAAAIDVSRQTTRTIRRGLFWAFVYNLVGLPLAASGLLSPVLAGLAMALSSLSVVANALRLRRWTPRDLVVTRDG